MKKIYPLVLLLILLYFALFPQNLSRTIAIERNWKVSLGEKGPVNPSFNDEARLLKSGTRISLLDSAGAYVMLEHVRYSAAVSNDFFINYDAISQALIVQDEQGRYHATLDTRGYPYFSGGRLFVITTDRGAMREWTVDGDSLESFEFPSVLTVLAASSRLIIAGFLNGDAWVYGQGAPVSLKTPDSSRYSAVYGTAAAENRETVAVVSGIGPQFLTVYDAEGETFVPVYSEALASDFRRPVHLRFFADDAYLLIETESGISIIETKDWKAIKSVSLAGYRDAAYDKGSNLFLLAGGDGQIIVTSPVSSYAVQTKSLWGPVQFGTFGSSFFVHDDGRICDLSIIAGGDA